MEDDTSFIEAAAKEILSEDDVTKLEKFFELYYYKKLVEVAREYPEKKSIIVDYWDLDKYDADLADKLLNSPEEVINAAKEAIKRIDLGVKDIDINVRFTNLPESCHVRIKDIRSEHLDKLIVIEGVIKTISDVRPECVEAVFRCPGCNKKIKVKQDGRRFLEPYQCDCGRRGKFILEESETKYLDAQRIRVQEPPEVLEGSEQPSQIYVHLVDDLVSPKERRKIMPGNRVKIVGIVKKVQERGPGNVRTPRYDIYIEANYVEPIEREFEEIELTKEDIEKIKELSKYPNLYDLLIDSIAPTIYGYREIKEAILLQLFGGVPKVQPDGTRIRGDIHIFLIGDPGTAKSQLLRYIANLAPKGRYVSGKAATTAGLTVTLVKDEFMGGWTLEAGALVLANKGIVCVDEFEKMSKEDRSALHEAMEQQTISVAKAGIVTTLKAETAILAAANPKYGRFDRYRPLYEQTDIGPTLLSRFDLKFPLLDIPKKENDEKLAEHILKAHADPDYIKPPIPPEFLRKYIAYARKVCKPKLSKEAIEEIKNFYVNLRSSYSEEAGAIVPLTPRQLEALIRLAEASAKVRLSDVVTREDAKRAIRLLEYSLKLLGTEPETGKIDIDRIEAGMSSSQRSKVTTLLTIIEDLGKNREDGVPIEEILDEAKSRGLEESEVYELIDKLKREGNLLEPRPGFIKKI